MALPKHQERIKQELKDAGVTKFGLMKFGSHYLPELIHENEHIRGVVYGRYRDKPGGAPLNEGMLIATDKRVIFLDHKPGYTEMDEVTYEVVAGIKITTAVFSTVTLHTRIKDYTIHFANSKCANIFVKYVETKRLTA